MILGLNQSSSRRLHTGTVSCCSSSQDPKRNRKDHTSWQDTRLLARCPCPVFVRTQEEGMAPGPSDSRAPGCLSGLQVAPGHGDSGSGAPTRNPWPTYKKNDILKIISVTDRGQECGGLPSCFGFEFNVLPWNLNWLWGVGLRLGVRAPRVESWLFG